MWNDKQILQNLINRLLPNRCFPELGIVKKVYEGNGKGKYCVDVEILIPGSLERTEETMVEVPISPIWAGKQKQGIYCIPEKDMILVIGFIQGNRAFPFVQGVYGNGYETAEIEKEELLITDGDKVKIKIKEEKITVNIGNDTEIITEDKKMTMKIGDCELVLDGNGNSCTVKADKINLTGEGATEEFVLGTTFKTAMETVITALQTHTHEVATSGSPTAQTGEAAPSSKLAAIQNPVANALSNKIKGA